MIISTPSKARRDTQVFQVLKAKRVSEDLLVIADNPVNQDQWESLVNKVKLDLLEVQVQRVVVVKEVRRAVPPVWLWASKAKRACLECRDVPDLLAILAIQGIALFLFREAKT